MLGWILTFLVIALIAGALGFGGIAGASAGIAQILFYIFLVLLLISLVMHVMRGPEALARRAIDFADPEEGPALSGAGPDPFLRALQFQPDQARSKRSAFITFVQAATKSLTNFFLESAQA